MTTVTEDKLAEMRTLAQSVAAHAYVPYSKFRVGAALLYEDGSIFSGCNIENISYGLTICAERSAVSRAISERGATSRIVAIAVTNLEGQASAPCGACRQILHEFAAPDAVITYRGGSGWVTRPFRELLPDAFDFNPERV
jgi:cytidine deaminase